MGRYSTIAVTARIIGANHPIGALSTHPYFYLESLGLVPENLVASARQTVEDDVWIGHNSIITPSCGRVGRGSIVGAGGVVMEDVPPYAIVTGSPAKLVRFRFSRELIALIEASQWWLLDKDELKRFSDAAPGFLVAPSIANANAFLAARGIAPPPAPAARPPLTLGGQHVHPEAKPGGSSGQTRLLAAMTSVIPHLAESNLEMRFEALKLDSLGYISLRLALEQALNQPIPEAVWARIATPADVLRLAPVEASALSLSSTDSSVRSKLLSAIRLAISGFSEDDLARPFAALNVDSLGFLNLRMAAEQALNRAIDDAIWGAIATPADLMALAPVANASGSWPTPAAPAEISRSPAPLAPLYWLPPLGGDFATELKRAVETRTWDGFVRVARHRLDFLETDRLHQELRAAQAEHRFDTTARARIKLAILSSSTCEHLVAGIHVGALRRNIALEVYTCDYGQYQQALLDAGSRLHAFQPDVILLALDTSHVLAGSDISFDDAAATAFIDARTDQIAALWRQAKDAFACQIIHQSVLPVAPTLLGNNEHRLAGSPSRLVAEVNRSLRRCAADSDVDWLDIESHVVRSGLSAWHDPALWGRAKQEISPLATPIFGDLVARLLAAQRGLSSKCLVLDLDNTLWGGVIGDDGLEGIRLGQGSAEGEAFVAFQKYVQNLSKTGVILAVCSKNDESVALAPFERHPEMVLERADIACFIANWDDKAANLRSIADSLNIALDALVLVDDNPFERNLVRLEAPLVTTLELPADPNQYAQCVADSGCFELRRLTDEDRARNSSYQGNIRREALKSDHTDLTSYLRSLNMELRWSKFDFVGVPRITQLINKTNQFNLRTQRYSERQVLDIMNDPNAIGLQFRLVDQFGDNGVIAVIIGRFLSEVLEIDTWLMSCRVLGRRVEEAALGVLVQEVSRRGGKRIRGEYLATERNGIVRDLYERLGFHRDNRGDRDDLWALSVADFVLPDVPMRIVHVSRDDQEPKRRAAE